MSSIAAELAAPFSSLDIRHRPGPVSGSRAMVFFYITVQAVQDRLDKVVGVANWEDRYDPIHDGCFMCQLSIRFNNEWITKSDVGAPTDVEDDGDKVKSACSDSLKRTAVKWGVGRYLYQRPPQWEDFDPATGKFLKTPVLILPTVALATKAKRELPATGRELYHRLVSKEAVLVKKGVCKKGELIAHIVKAGVWMKWPSTIVQWNSMDQIRFAAKETKSFENLMRQAARLTPETVKS